MSPGNIKGKRPFIKSKTVGRIRKGGTARKNSLFGDGTTDAPLFYRYAGSRIGRKGYFYSLKIICPACRRDFTDEVPIVTKLTQTSATFNVIVRRSECKTKKQTKTITCPNCGHSFSKEVPSGK